MENLPDSGNASTYGGASGGGGQGSYASCSESITASWKWTPAQGMTMTTDPPPTTVVVAERCTASATIVSPVSTGEYDNGMRKSGAPVWGQNNNTGSATSVRYTSHSGGPTVTLPAVTPTAYATPDGAGCSVSYTANIYPIFVIPGGAVKDSSGVYNILVGQSCTGSLSSLPSQCTVSNYQWGVTGTTFQSWTVSADQSHTTEVDGPGRSDQPTARWYWNDNNGSGKSKVEQVICTATVTPPAGQGSAFTVTATTPVTVWVPYWTCTGTGGAVYVRNISQSGSPNYVLEAASTAGPLDIGGMDWLATVASPLVGTFGDGTIALVQLDIPGRTFFAAGYDYYWSTNGQEGLDTSYPYGWTHNWTSQEPYYDAYDSPGFRLPETPPTSPASTASLQDQFEDTLLYTPPGSSQCVPLAKFVWTTNGSAVEPLLNGTYSWAFYGSGSAGTVTPTGTQPFVQINAFPNWTQNSGNSAGYWME